MISGKISAASDCLRTGHRCLFTLGGLLLELWPKIKGKIPLMNRKIGELTKNKGKNPINEPKSR
ncbi:hypothetical protein R70723_11630 [Paenibacillus sp. FSL R7-0273]|nr:hypothetical protein R70723_11630 [Paenibacillus sp. FSL R7-0273]